MINNKSITLVLPSRNVGKIIKKQLDSIPSFIDKIIIVSNNSKDDTYKKAIEYSQSHPRVQVFQDDRVDASGIGYGYAISTGFENSTTDYTFKADFDGTYPVEKIIEFVEYLEKNDGLFAVGTRYPVAKESHVKLFNTFGVWVLNNVNWIRNGTKFNDILCGLYGGKTEAIKQLNCTEGGWNYSIEFKLRAAKMFKNKVFQFKILQAQSLTVSHQKYFQTGWLHLNYLLNFSR